MLFNFIFNSFTGIMLTITFMILNILSFVIFLFCDEEKNIKYDKIFKFIEPIGVLFCSVVLFLISIPLFLIFIYNALGTILSIAILVFEISSWSSIISYFILRFFPIKKLNLLIKKLLSYSLLIGILTNIVFMVFLLISQYSALDSVYSFLPISVSILYLKTLLIIRNEL